MTIGPLLPHRGLRSSGLVDLLSLLGETEPPDCARTLLYGSKSGSGHALRCVFTGVRACGVVFGVFRHVCQTQKTECLLPAAAVGVET